MSLPHIVTAGLDDLIPVVIIITVIIGRIMKAAQQGKPTPPTTPGTRSRPTHPKAQSHQPADELREFLQALSGETELQSEPPPPPPPPRQVKPLRSAPPSQPIRVVRPATPVQPTPPAPQPKPQPRVTKRHEKQTRPKLQPVRVEQNVSRPLRESLNKHLADKQSLRAAWLLREVLGPPVGLR